MIDKSNLKGIILSAVILQKKSINRITHLIIDTDFETDNSEAQNKYTVKVFKLYQERMTDELFKRTNLTLDEAIECYNNTQL